MSLPAAEIARTLAMGRLTGTITVAGGASGLPVLHAADRHGDILIAATAGSELAEALRETDDLGAVLAVEDQPPFEDSPHLGTVWIAGWVSLLTGLAAREAAVDFAESNPLDCLLDVGNGVDLFRIESAEIRLVDESGSTSIAVDDFARAVPDPFHIDEHELLQDLRDHHLIDLAAAAGRRDAIVQPVRLDRNGLVLRVNQDLARMDFPYPAHGPCCIARILQFRGH